MSYRSKLISSSEHLCFSLLASLIYHHIPPYTSSTLKLTTLSDLIEGKLSSVGIWRITVLSEGRRQKKRIFNGQADRKRPPPHYSQLFVIFFGVFVYLKLSFYVFWNGFHTRKVIFIQLQEFPTPPYCRCCSVTKQSDSGIAEALKA